MSVTAASSRPAGIPGRLLAFLVAVTAGLVAAFVVGPRVLAADRSVGFADEGQLTAAVRDAFIGYWHSGTQDFSPALDQVVDYWIRYHVAKAVIAAILLVVFVAIGVRVWQSFLVVGGAGRRVALASAGIVATMLGLFSLVVVVANVQGALVPFASLLPMLMGGESSGELPGVLAEIRQQLSTGTPTSPAVDAMISDFARYHAVLAVLAAVVAVGLVGVSVVFWRRFARSADRRTKRVLGSYGAFALVCALTVGAVAIANATTAADPVPALLAFFEGGW